MDQLLAVTSLACSLQPIAAIVTGLPVGESRSDRASDWLITETSAPESRRNGNGPRPATHTPTSTSLKPLACQMPIGTGSSGFAETDPWHPGPSARCAAADSL